MLLKKGIDRLCKRVWVDAKILHNEFRGLISLVFFLPLLLLLVCISESQHRCRRTKLPDTDRTASDISETFLPVLSDSSMTQRAVVGEQNNGKII